MKKYLQPIGRAGRLGLLLLAIPAVAAAEGLIGRWALTLPNGAAGWLEIRQEADWYDGSILWGGGSVLPVSSVVIENGTATITRTREVQRKNAAGEVVRTQQYTETITAREANGGLSLTRVAPRLNGKGFDRAEFTGRRIPDLPARPDLGKVRFGEAIDLIAAGPAGWRLIEENAPSGWTFADGQLSNRPVQREGQPRVRFGNLRTNQEFEDFNLTLEVRVPEKSNSGVYLRGIYEVQVADSHGKPVDSHNMGAIYSRITPTVSAEKPAGEWQHLDITLVDRHVTVVLNGSVIIDNQPLEGCTGGALWSDVSRPGPIYLQGDHGPVDYRNVRLRPVLK